MARQSPVRRTMDLAQVMLVARREQGLTQAELAARARVSPRWLSLFENGKNPGAEVTKVLGVFAALGITLVAQLPESGK